MPPRQSDRSRSLLSSVGATVCLGLAGFWFWLHRPDVLVVGFSLVAIAAAIPTAWARDRRWQWLGTTALTIGTLGALLSLYSSARIGEPVVRLGEDRVLRSLLLLSVMAGIHIVALSLYARGIADALPRLTFRIASRSRAILYVVYIVALLFSGAEFFSLGSGERFFLPEAKHHPIHAFPLGGSFQYAHATERMVTDTHGFTFEQRKPDGVVRIVLNGASTMGAFGLIPPNMIADGLRRAIRKKLPGRRTEVIQLAISGKYQLNELIDSVVVLPHWNPDLVVSMNGINEIFYGEEANHFEGMPYTEPAVDEMLAVHPGLAWFLANTHIGSVSWKRRWYGRWQLPNRLHDPAPYEPPRYFGYLQRTAHSLASSGIPYAYSYCPNIYTWDEDHGPAPGPLDSVAKAARHRRREAARVITEAGQISFDAMEAFEGFDNGEQVFLDDCHLERPAVDSLVGYLAERIPGWLEHRDAVGGSPPAPPETHEGR